jgi:hypothetical protein
LKKVKNNEGFDKNIIDNNCDDEYEDENENYDLYYLIIFLKF